MKAGNIALWLTTWMSRLDRLMNPEKSCTNPFLGTFLLYVFLVMGITRYSSGTPEALRSLDDVYNLMRPQDKGMGIMCLVFLGAETIMLCGEFADILTRCAIIVLAANMFYMGGLFLPVVSQIMLGLIIFAYIYMFFVLAGDTVRRISGGDLYSAPPDK